MSLFKRKEKEAPALEFPFVLSGGFRGYKRFPIVVYGDAESEKNNAELAGIALKGKQVVFRSAMNGSRPFLIVLIDGKKVGAVFDDAKVAEVLSGKVDAVYAMTEDETVAGAGGVETRTRVRVFVKYAGG